MRLKYQNQQKKNTKKQNNQVEIEEPLSDFNQSNSDDSNYPRPKIKEIYTEIRIPNMIHEYIYKARGVDRFDQLATYYVNEHKSIKWYKKLVNLFLKLLLGIHIFYKEVCIKVKQKYMPHVKFRLEIITGIIKS